MEDFSLNLLCREKSHLIPMTLDSLIGQPGSFEVILLDAGKSGHLAELVSRYRELNIRVEKALELSLPQMMNLGVSVSRGKYVQFLEPGERYISSQGMKLLTDLIGEAPSLISARGVAVESRSHWLAKKEIINFGGFDESLQVMPMLDLLCRFQKRGIAPQFCNRALMDLPQEPARSTRENCRILYRHFGSRSALTHFFRTKSKVFRKIADFCAGAFRKKES